MFIQWSAKNIKYNFGTLIIYIIILEKYIWDISDLVKVKHDKWYY